MKKTKLLVSVVVFIALSLLFLLVSCGEEPPPEPEVKSYTVTFDYGTETKSLEVDKGDVIPSPKPQKREGYEFGGWYYGDNKWDFSQPPDGDMTLTAKWDPISYRIVYTLAGGTAEGNPTAYNADFDDFTLVAPTKRGYTFVGWIVDGQGEPVSQYTVKKGTVGSKSFSAVWMKCQHPGELVNGETCSVCGADAFVYYEEFGAVGDGVTDDFGAFLNTHKYANENGSIVRARAGAVYYLGESSRRVSIPVMTDVEWGDITIIIDDTIITPDGGCGMAVFDVCPIYSSVDFKNVAKAPLSAGAKNVGFEPGRPMLLHIVDTTAPRKYIRYGMNANSGSKQEEVILIDAKGNVDSSTPIEWDYNSLSTVVGYPADEDAIVINGFGTTVVKTLANIAPNKYTYYSRTITVTRANTTVKGIYHDFDETLSVTRAPYDGFVKIYKAHNVTVEDCVFTEHSDRLLEGTTNNSMGSYEIAATLSNKISWIRCTQSNFYGADGYARGGGIMGTNNCRNMLFDGCQVTSFDAHTAAYNVTLKNSTCEHLNFIGAGDILLENMTVYSDIKEAALVLRNDYGCTWNGNVTIKNLTLKSKSDSPEIDLIKAQYVNHDFGMRTYLPNTVKIDGIYVKQYSVSFDGGGNRVETVKDVFHAKIHIYKYLAGFQSDISLESSSNLNPYTPTRQLYIDNAQANITWVFPKAPQFKNMQIYIDGRYQEWRNG